MLVLTSVPAKQSTACGSDPGPLCFGATPLSLQICGVPPGEPGSFSILLSLPLQARAQLHMQPLSSTWLISPPCSDLHLFFFSFPFVTNSTLALPEWHRPQPSRVHGPSFCTHFLQGGLHVLGKPCSESGPGLKAELAFILISNQVA